MTDIQTLFDTAVRGVIAQGKPAVQGEKCRYRDGNGNKCAVGQVLPDDKYDPLFDARSTTIDDSTETGARLRKAVGLPSSAVAPEVLIMQRIQRAHDLNSADEFQSVFVERFKSDAREVALQYGLKTDALD